MRRQNLPKLVGRLVAIATLVLATEGALAGPPRDNPAAVTAFNEVRAAQSEITKVIVELRRAFEQSPDYRSAQADLQRTGADYRNTCDRALLTLKSSLGYKQAAERVLQLQRRLDGMRYDDKITPQQRERAARELLAARAVISQMESGVLSADPDVATARYTWQDANGKVIAMRREFLASIATSPAFTAAKARLEAAHQRVPQPRR
jgi:hypothetical protein